MKILILFDKQNKMVGEDFFSMLQDSSGTADIEKIFVENDVSNDEVLDSIVDATHIAAFFSTVTDIFIYAAAFSAGKGSKFSYLNSTHGDVIPHYLRKSIVFKTTDALLNYFAEEIKAFPLEMAKITAKSELLDKGIPFTSEVFANCVEKNDAAACSLFVKAGFSANEKDTKGVPLLCLAARSGSLEMVQFLLDNGADPNLVSIDRGNSAIIDAALGKHDQIIALLLQNNADPNIKSKDGQGALIIAVGLGDEKSSSLLIKAGANPDDPDSLGTTARKYALLLKREAILQQLDNPDEQEVKVDV
ncbi:MAG: hypothetical protein Ta2G_12240 [Termitinemataceae bacterium]|nr:MAG: hypothetical protein Ta2G_12240 [Termitinemataceae bacterium]